MVELSRRRDGTKRFKVEQKGTAKGMEVSFSPRECDDDGLFSESRPSAGGELFPAAQQRTSRQDHRDGNEILQANETNHTMSAMAFDVVR